MSITERQHALLNTIVEEYIRSAKPISSKLLSVRGYFDLSPAAIRLEMGELERRGFLTQRHTSGGRMPTDKAYRYYVDNLEVGNFQLSRRYRNEIHKAIDKARGNARELNRIIANVLSELSNSMVITNILESDDYFKSGLCELLSMPEFREFEKILKVTSFFEDFETLFNEIYEKAIQDSYGIGAIRVMIGRENPVREIRGDTIIQTTYRLPERRTGSLTMIGPTRMDYSRNLGLIRYTIDELEKLV